MLLLPIWLFPTFFLVAFFYAIIGFAGGSSYLAFLAMTSLPLYEVAAIALFCNLVVASGGVWHFSKAGQMRLKMLFPFLVTSIPAAYFGGLMKVEASVHGFLLGICLLLVGWRIWFGNPEHSASFRKPAGLYFTAAALVIGGVLGFFAGFLGIGGGIFLSPVLILAGWASAKESAAAASLFILLNSAAGLLARWPFLYEHAFESILLGAVVFVGGQFGSRIGAYHLPNVWIRKLLSGFISWVGFRLLWAAL